MAKKKTSTKKRKTIAKKPKSSMVLKKNIKKKSSSVSSKKLVKPIKKKEDRGLKAEQLLAKGRERGYITYNEILKSFPTIEDDVFFLEELYEKFGAAGIDVLEGGNLLEQIPEVSKKQGYKRADGAHD